MYFPFVEGGGYASINGNISSFRRAVGILEMCREHLEVWIALLKASIVFIQHSSCQFRILAGGAHIFLVSDLQDDLVEWLLLIAGANFLVIVWDSPVCTGLLFVVAFQSLIEKLVVYGLDALVAIVNVQVHAASVYIFSFAELSSPAAFIRSSNIS